MNSLNQNRVWDGQANTGVLIVRDFLMMNISGAEEC